MVPSLIVIAIGLDPTRTLVLSQVVLSFGLPFAIIPLVMFTRRKDIMGVLVNRRITTADGQLLGGCHRRCSTSTCFTRSSSGGEAMFKHLLVPLDGSKLSESALPAAVHLAQALDASVTLIHVIEKDAPREVHKDRHLTDPEEASGLSERCRRRASSLPLPRSSGTCMSKRCRMSPAASSSTPRSSGKTWW